MDTVADALHQINVEDAMQAGLADGKGPSINNLEGEVALTLVPALMLFAGSAIGLGLVIYFFVQLSDCQDDLINPYTLCDHVNKKLNWELIAHAVAVCALILEEIIDGDRLHWVASVLALPGLMLRLLWWKQKKLEIDPTNVFNTRFSGQLKTRWGIMCAWHGLTLLFGFVQLVLHMVLGLHNNLPKTMQAIGEHHVKRAQSFKAMGAMGGLHPMNHMMFGH